MLLQPSASVCGRDCIQLLRFVSRVISFVFCCLINETKKCPIINNGYVLAPLSIILSKSWWTGWHHHSPVPPNSPTEDSLTHTTQQSSSSVLGLGDFQCSSSPSIVKRQWVFAAFASLYGCVLVTTSAAKLLENQQLEDSLTWHWQSLKIWSWFAFESISV